MGILINNIMAEGIYKHFMDCQICIDGVNLLQHVQKLRLYATTIEMWESTQLVGLCACYMNDVVNQVAYITHIAISPQYRKQNYGKQLLELTISIAQEKGFKRLDLEVAKDNTTALHLYRSHHFEITEDRCSKYLMSLPLTVDKTVL